MGWNSSASFKDNICMVDTSKSTCVEGSLERWLAKMAIDMYQHSLLKKSSRLVVGFVSGIAAMVKRAGLLGKNFKAELKAA